MTTSEGHLEDQAGERWMVFSRHSTKVPVPDQPNCFTFGPADYWGVAHRSDLDRRIGGDFATREEAMAFAHEQNQADLRETIPPEFVERWSRLKKLAPYFRAWAYEGPPGGRWPAEPERFLIFDAGVGWHAESWEYLAADRDAIEEKLSEEESNVYRIVDLDTGLDVPFTRTIHVSVEMP